MALASAVNGGAPPKAKADVGALLEKSKLDKLPFQLQPEQDVFQVLVDGQQEALADTPPRVACTFVDLTSRGTLPLWLPQEAIGGRVHLSGDSELLNGSSGTQTLSQLTQALRGATAAPRFFRTMGQWTATFMRFGIAATAAGQWQMSEVLTHIDVILQLSEQEKAAGQSPFVALVYDEMVRRSWELRALRRDSTFTVANVVCDVDKTVLVSARSRVDSVLRAAGLGEPGPEIPAAAVASDVESVLAKQQAAMDALQKRNDAQARTLAKMQPPFQQADGGRQGQGADGGKSGGKGGGAPSPGISRAQQKKHNFFAKVKEKRKGGGYDSHWRGQR